MQRIYKSFGIAVVAGVALVGCHKAATETGPTATPTTMMMPETNGNQPGPTTMAVPPANQTTVVLPATKAPAAKDLTHVLTKDEPFFLNEPAADAKPVGTLKAGSKVLVLIPGAMYSQVLTDTGISAYTMTDGLKPLGK